MKDIVISCNLVVNYCDLLATPATSPPGHKELLRYMNIINRSYNQATVCKAMDQVCSLKTYINSTYVGCRDFGLLHIIRLIWVVINLDQWLKLTDLTKKQIGQVKWVE